MTRRSRRASSAPQRVGSDKGLISSRPRIDEPDVPDASAGLEQAHPTPDPDHAEPSDHGEKQVGDGDAEASTRHTRPKVDQSKDDTDQGWGERGDDDASARWLRENRPPHWE